METLGALLNPAGQAIPIQASRTMQADSFAIPGTGANRSFTEIYEQLLAMLPQAAPVYGDNQSADKQVMFANVLERKAEVEDGKCNLPGSEAFLAETLSAWPLTQVAKPDDAPEKQAMIETFAAGNNVNPVISKFIPAPGDLGSSMAQQPIAGPLDGAIVSTSLVQPGIDEPARQGNRGKILAVAETPGDKPATPASFIAMQTVFEGPIWKTGNENKFKATPTPVTKNAAATANSNIIKPDFDKAVSQKGHQSLIMTTSGSAATAETTVNSGAAQFNLQNPVGPTGKHQKTVTVTEQPVSSSSEAAIPGNDKIKSGLDKPIKSAEKEMKIKATPGQPERAQARPAVAENAVRPASQESIKAGGEEVKFHPAAGKKADKAMVTRDPAGELNQLPGLHNTQVTLERPGADKPVMAKSQIDLIVNHLAGQINSGSSSLEVDLQPEALGKIKLMFQMEDGSLTVRIIAHTEEAHHLLDASLQSMKENLNQQGIKISDMSLDLANQEKQGNQTGSGHKEAVRPAKMFGDQKESYENTGIWEQTSSQYSRLNILA